MKKFAYALSFICLLYPSFALAAGFAKDTLFLSKNPVTAGETVRIYTIVANNSTTPFTGSVVLTDGTVQVAQVKVSMDAGGTQTASAAWKPTAGSHTIKASLTGSDSKVVEEESATFTIAAPPTPVVATTPASLSAASVDSSAPIQKDIANVSPQVATAAEPVFTVIDGARASIASLLDNQISSTKDKLANTPKPGLVLGSSTSVFTDPGISNPWGTFWFALYTAYLYILTALRWLVGNAGIFYPFIAIAFLFSLWRIYRRMRRPAY